jgi:hypothetical protein
MLMRIRADLPPHLPLKTGHPCMLEGGAVPVVGLCGGSGGRTQQSSYAKGRESFMTAAGREW